MQIDIVRVSLFNSTITSFILTYYYGIYKRLEILKRLVQRRIHFSTTLIQTAK